MTFFTTAISGFILLGINCIFLFMIMIHIDWESIADWLNETRLLSLRKPNINIPPTPRLPDSGASITDGIEALMWQPRAIAVTKYQKNIKKQIKRINIVKNFLFFVSLVLCFAFFVWANNLATLHILAYWPNLIALPALHFAIVITLSAIVFIYSTGFLDFTSPYIGIGISAWFAISYSLCLIIIFAIKGIFG